MADPLAFDATIEEAPRNGGAWVVIPFDVQERFGTRGQVKVKATFDGHHYRGSLAPMGGGRHVLGIAKAVRQAIGKAPGDAVHVTLEADTEPRVVEVPPDLRAVLDGSPKAAAEFERIPYSHKRRYVQWIDEAKRPETREKRVREAVERLLGS